jgi:RNA polymerase sigma factor, sigma-70 family
MNNEIFVKYINKILSFSQNRTYSQEEAEELTQEILLQAMKNVSTINDINKFEAWLWGVANNTLKSFRRGRGRIRDMYSPEDFEDIGDQIYYDEYEIEQDDIYSTLRKNITQLSASYRDIIVMYYYDNLTSAEIAERLNIPEGTVRYRLSLGRNKLKKELDTMQETALKPVRLNLYTQGSYGGFPQMYLNDALSQNILWQTYKESRNVEDLSKILGVPAYYIEDRIEILLKCGTITQPTQSTILTDIIIYDESINKYDEAQSKECIKALSDILFEKANIFAVKTLELDIFTANKSYDELMCLFCTMAFDHFEKKHNIKYEWYDIPEKFDGWQWEFYAQTTEYKSVFFFDNRNWIDTAHHTIGHMVYVFPPFKNINAMSKDELSVCEKIIKGESITDDEKEYAAMAIKNEFVKKTGDKSELNIPFFPIAQYEQFKEMLPDVFEDIMPLYQKQVKKYSDGYIKLFPKHLRHKAEGMCYSIFYTLIKKVIIEWVVTGKVNISPESICSVLVEHDGGMFFKL